RAALGIGLTRTSADFNTGRHPPVLFDPHADALYQLVGGGAPLGILESLRLRAAWAQSSAQNLGALNRPAFDYGGTSFGGYGYGANGPLRPRTPADRSTELEGGIDAASGVAASRLSITAFTRKERLDWIAPFFLANTADRKVTGGELAAEATPLDLPVARLHVRGQLAVSHDRVESVPGSRAQLSSGPGIGLMVRDGQSWGTWLTQPASWNDANGNGRIERTEVSYFDVRTGGRSRPASVAKLSGDLELLHSFTVTAIADHVGGFDVYDAAGAQQCWRGVCPALNDPNAPIDEQGRAVAASTGHGSGYLVPGDATTLRELSLSWRSPRAATMLHATTLGVTLSAYDLARWSRSRGLHPETDAPAPGLRPDLWAIVQPVPRTFAVRVAVGY
ncbi:MAG TPA: TonB-dependent receptor, partial [Gemmatimonadaceae bacterium]|nr:TonB-dependent receptor [Gemmatimonadaceae bacterium]